MYNMLDYIRSIVDKSPLELDRGYSQYALNIYFSKFKNCIFLINAISHMQLSDKIHYDYLMKVIPRGWQKKLDFPKLTDKKQSEINVIMKHYNINEKDAQDYLFLMDKNELNILKEEERFKLTLDKGYQLIESLIEKADKEIAEFINFSI